MGALFSFYPSLTTTITRLTVYTPRVCTGARYVYTIVTVGDGL